MSLTKEKKGEIAYKFCKRILKKIPLSSIVGILSVERKDFKALATTIGVSIEDITQFLNEISGEIGEETVYR